MAPRCCGIQGLRTIRVGNSKAGVAGLNRVLKEAFRSGRRPDQQGLKKALVDALRAEGNYIAASSEEDYGATLVELYREHLKEAKPRAPTSEKNK